MRHLEKATQAGNDVRYLGLIAVCGDMPASVTQCRSLDKRDQVKLLGERLNRSFFRAIEASPHIAHSSSQASNISCRLTTTLSSDGGRVGTNLGIGQQACHIQAHHLSATPDFRISVGLVPNLIG
jgi:hypothetical protein